MMHPVSRLLVALVLGGGAAAQGITVDGPASPSLTTVSWTRFTSGSLGLDDTFTTGNTRTGGCCWIDYNGDYWPDLFITNGSGSEHLLYRNDGDGTFTNVSFLVLKPDILLEDAGALFGDLDNDGDEDLLVIVDDPVFDPLGPNPVEGGPNLLYVNQGDGTFVEDGLAAGIVDPLGRRNITGALGDIDRDGWLDAFLARWAPDNEAGLVMDDRVLKNAGDGTFVDATAETRVDSYGRQTLACQLMDFDVDGWPDLYVACVGPTMDEPDSNDILYQNCNDGVMFCDVTGDPHVIGDDARSAAGVDVGDVDNDGDLDVYVTDGPGGGTVPSGNVLYLANGDGTFADDSCDVAGVCADSSWPCTFLDVDLDGWVDLFVGTTEAGSRDYVFHNNGDGTFGEFRNRAILGNEARGAAAADYDGDGDVDLFIQNLNSPSALYRNDTGTDRHWIELKLVGTASNRSAIGAIVRVTAGGTTQTRLVTGGDGAHSQSELAVHFGVGEARAVDVAVDWPSGAQQAFAEVPVDLFHVVDEDAGLVVEELTSPAATWSAGGETLTVTAGTTLRGRSALVAQGLGPLGYDVGTATHTATFAAEAAPDEVTVTSAHGGAWVLPVTPAP